MILKRSYLDRTWSALRPICMARISSIMLKLSSCPRGSYFDSCSFSSFLKLEVWNDLVSILAVLQQNLILARYESLDITYGIRTLSSELDTVLVSRKLFRILSTCSASTAFSSLTTPSSGGRKTAAGVKGYWGKAFLPVL